MTEPLFSLPMIERFIGFNTVSSHSNLPLIRYVADYLGNLGIDCILTHDDTGQKANLFATIGPSDRPGIILSGHTDVVPCEDQSWSSDPFHLRQEADRVFGRGTCDMKGFLAIATAFAPEFARRRLKTPIHLAMSYDEEVGCFGVQKMLRDLSERNITPRACIVGEPSGMQVIRAHKGMINGHVTVTGLPAHSGVPHLGVNAAEAAAEAITRLNAIARRLRTQGPFDPDFEDPPYSSVQTCTVNGGTAVNVVAAQCSFSFNIRYLPGQDPMDFVRECRSYVETEIEPDMRARAPEAGFQWDILHACKALGTAEDADVTQLAKELSETSHSSCVGFGTEAGYFQAAGIPTIICGPGDIAQAHKADEFLTHEQIARCEKFLWKLLDRVSC